MNELWTSQVAPGWLPLAWGLSATAWGLVSLLWAWQATLAAQTTRWPAMYIHGFKMAAGLIVVCWFVFSLMWREPSTSLTWGVLSRNIVGGVVVFALFIEAIWRIKEAVKSRAQGKL